MQCRYAACRVPQTRQEEQSQISSWACFGNTGEGMRLPPHWCSLCPKTCLNMHWGHKFHANGCTGFFAPLHGTLDTSRFTRDSGKWIPASML